MDTFDSAETSKARSRPVILYTITTSSQVFRHTTNAMDVMFGDQRFTALTIAHDDEESSQDTDSELIIHLPISHPVVQRFASTGIPDQSVTLLVQELQSSAVAAVSSWYGNVQSISCGNQIADLRVPLITSDALRTKLSVISAQRTCQHTLFDSGCAPHPGDFNGGPTREAFTLTATLDSVSADGLTLTFRFLGGLPDAWFDFGKLYGTIFDASFAGELQTRRVLAQVGTVVTIDVPFVGTVDQILATVWSIEAGCDHAIASHCVFKYNNRPNYGGHPDLNASINPWADRGFGVRQT